METSELLANAAQSGAALGIDCGKMCNDCAFKVGTEANNDGIATEGAFGCIMSDGDFYCHTPEFQKGEKVCAGFLYAKKYFISSQFLNDMKIKKNG